MIDQNNKTFEYCPIFPSDMELAETVVAFSNTSGGEIAIHIGDVLDPFEYCNKAKLIICTLCRPRINFKIMQFAMDETCMISIMILRGSLLPCYLLDAEDKKSIYIRENDANILVRASEKSVIERIESEIVFDQVPNTHVSVQDVHLETLAQSFKSNYMSTDKEELLRLNLIGLVSGKIYLTNALLIITGYQNSARIKCSYYNNDGRDVLIDSKLCKGDLMMQVWEAEEFLESYLPKRKAAISEQYFVRHPLPMHAIREGLINAVLHRDYSYTNRYIEVDLCDRWLKIVSPGTIPDQITNADIQKGYSYCRNPNIARIYKELKVIDHFGGGINSIISWTDKLGLVRPSWEEKNNCVELTLYRLIEEKEYPYGCYDLTDQEQNVISFLVNHSYRVCTSDVERICFVKARAARAILSSLVQKGCIEKVARGPSTFYKAILKKRQNP